MGDIKDLADLDTALYQVIKGMEPIIQSLIRMSNDKNHIGSSMAYESGSSVLSVVQTLITLTGKVRSLRGLASTHKELENWRSLSPQERISLVQKYLPHYIEKGE